MAAFVLLSGLGVVAPPAAAQLPCPVGGPGAIQVEITEPADGATVSGVIPVRGRVQAALGVEITQIEISMGNVAAGGEYQPASSHTFDYRLDTSRLPKGPMTLRAVACDRRELGALIARGTREITVTVEKPDGADPEGDDSGAAVVPPGALILRQAGDDADQDRPIWAGVVVGVSGALGLAIAALSWRRRGPLADGADTVAP